MAVEIFQTGPGSLYVNEIIAHPHRAFQYTFNYPSFSQYEALIKAVTGWPVKVSDRFHETVVMQVIRAEDRDLMFTQAQIKPDWFFTFYDNLSTSQSGEYGHVVIPSKQVNKTLDQLSDIFG